jgi:HEAT repeat protein
MTAVALTWVVARIRTRYAEALVRTLRAGLAEQLLEGGPGLAAMGRAPGVADALRTALTDSSAGTRRLAADLLGRLGDATSLAALDATLSDDAPEVRAAGLRAIATLDPARGGDVAARLAGDADPTVRAEAVVALARWRGLEPARARLDALLGGERAARLAGLRAAGRIGDPGVVGVLREAVADPDPAVRVAAATALGDMPASAAQAVLVSALDDDAAAVRRAAADAIGGLEGMVPALIGVLGTGSERAQEAAIRGLAGGAAGGNEVAVRAWALRRVERAVALRRHAASLRPAVPVPAGAAGTSDDATPALEFLRTLLERRSRRLEDQLLAAVAALGAPAAQGVLRRCLRSPDPDTRAQAIEAIDALGDRRLAQAFVRLLDSDAGPGGSSGDAALQALADDEDPWIRTLAMRAASEALAQRQAVLGRRAAADPDPAVRTRLDTMQFHGGSTMADTASTLGELDRMLFLRRVPLFGQLDPEDLQRLAATATERVFDAGEALVREGEPGDELIVLVEGSVRVVRMEDGVERQLRTFGAGDHIGELAVLRDRPRAATVVAETPVRGLVIGGDGLRAILTERPEAAMAMLGTLAERISAQ